MPYMLRNLTCLTVANMLYITAASLLISSLAVIAQGMAPDPALATLPVAVTTVGIMLGTVPAARLNHALGRRLGSMAGMLFAMIGTAGLLIGMIEGWFWVLTFAALPIGVGNAFAAHYRFAAAEAASEQWRERAISWSMIGGVMAGLAGPWIAAQTQSTYALPFLGTLFALGMLQVLNLLVVAGLKMPKPKEVPHDERGRELKEIFANPRARFALVGSAIGYTLMAFVMTATPLAIIGCGYLFADSAFVIQWHVVGMFAPSLFTGNLIGRFGAPRVMAAGAVAYLIAAGIGLSGLDLMLNFWPTLVLLGIGWNFLFIGGTSLITECYTPQERPRVQGFNDLVVFSCVAIGSLSSGTIYAWAGWEWVVASLVPLSLLVLVLFAKLSYQTKAAAIEDVQ